MHASHTGATARVTKPLGSSGRKLYHTVNSDQSKALEKAQREAKSKFVAQPELSHEAAQSISRSQANRTDETFPGVIHVSHQLALLLGHENVFFCTQCGAVNAGGALGPLKFQCVV